MIDPRTARTAVQPRPIRVGYLLPDFGVGGGQTILLRTLAAMGRPGWDHVEHTVVALHDGPMRAHFDATGVRTVLLRPAGPAGHAGGLRRLVRLIRSDGIDVVVSLNTPHDRSYAQLAARCCGVPVVIWFMSVAVPLLGFPPPRGRELAFLKRLALLGPNVVSVRRAAALMSLSTSVSRSFAAHLRLPEDRFRLVPPGLPGSAFDPPLDPSGVAALRRDLGLGGGGGPVLLNVGMLIDLKGQRALVEAMPAVLRRLPGATLLLVGEGPDRPRLEAAVAAAGLGRSVRLLGHRHDVPALLQVADGLVSASRSEGFGMALLEAMAAGKPTVAVHTPAFDEFAADGVTTCFVAGQEPELLARGIADVFGDPARAAAMGRAARTAAERFRVERTAETVLDVLAEVVAEGAGDDVARAAALAPTR